MLRKGSRIEGWLASLVDTPSFELLLCGGRPPGMSAIWPTMVQSPSMYPPYNAFRRSGSILSHFLLITPRNRAPRSRDGDIVISNAPGWKVEDISRRLAKSVSSCFSPLLTAYSLARFFREKFEAAFA